MRQALTPRRLVVALVVALLALGGLVQPANAATARTLSVKVSSTGVVAKGGVTFSGVLSKSPKGSAVMVQRKSGKKWVAAKSTKTTSASGAWSVRVTMPSKVGTYTFRAVAAKSGALAAATSKAVKVASLRKTAVTIKASPRTVNAGSKSTFSGTVKPFVKNGLVTIQRQNAQSKWVTAGSAKVSVKGTYAVAIPVTVTAVFRAVSARAGLNAPGTSLNTVVITNPAIATSSLPGGSVGSAYSTTLKTVGDVVGKWTAAPLPAGLSVNADTGVISGTPTTQETKQVVIGFTQAISKQKAPSKTLTLTVTTPQPPVITTTNPLPGATQGVAYSKQLAATNGPGTWTNTAPLPNGLTLSAGGLLSGTPTAAATTTVSVKFTNDNTNLFATKVFDFTISPPPPPPTITTAALPDGVIGEAYATTLSAGAATGTWSVDQLPAGLTLTPSTGAISGTPTGPATTTAVTVNFTATGNPTPATPKVLNLKVTAPKPVIVTTSLPDAKILTAYSAQLQVSGGIAGTWSVGASDLTGTGLSLNTTTGVISGTASIVPQTVHLTVGFTDGTTAADTKALTIKIANADPSPDVKVAAGGQFTCRTDSDGKLWCWGYDDSGELGDGGVLASDPPGVLKPKQVGTATDWTGVTAGNGLVTERHACALRGTAAYCWGDDQYGELGNAATVGSATAPVLVDGGLAWSQLSAGSTSTCGVTTTGALYCWGDNSFSQLGVAGGNAGSPQRVGTNSAWTGVSVGYNSACATRGDGTLWCWGSNFRGQLGNGDATRSAQDTPVQVGSATTWSKVVVGSGYACGLQSDGTLWCWGITDQGAVANGQTANDSNVDVISPAKVGSATNWTDVAVGTGQGCAVNSGGQLWCWGKNVNGQVGNNSTNAQSTPVRIGTGTDWASVSAGDGHSCAVKTSGAISCWGNNNKGQLGNNSTAESHVPVAVVG